MQSICLINSELCDFNNIVQLSQPDYIQKALSIMPRKFYKYFPNTISPSTGKNHSLEALESNTVFLQSPINFDDPYDSSITLDLNSFGRQILSYYADGCGLSLHQEWDLNRVILEFSVFLYRQIQENHTILSLFGSKAESDNKIALSYQTFALTIENTLLNNRNSEDAWQKAFRQVIINDFEHTQEFLVKKFRISCFTTSPYSMLMWSHYANCHKGFCIEYDIPADHKPEKIFINMYPVIYSRVRTSVLKECIEFLTTPRISDSTLWHIYMHGLLSKNIDWCYQNEWRLISYDSHLADAGNYNCTFTPM